MMMVQFKKDILIKHEIYLFNFFISCESDIPGYTIIVHEIR